MAKVITDNQHYADIAEAIRTKNETETLYKPSEMAAAILEIQGGGADLNFEVVGGTSQPTNPVENTIWVNTPNEITGWGFGAEADKPVSPDPGMVWFVTAANGIIKFNALKEDSIIVAPHLAHQYVSGTWENISIVKIYQSGSWVDWAEWLYVNGDQCVELTGGWQKESGTGTVEFREDCIYFSNGSQKEAYTRTVNRVNLNGVKKILVKMRSATVPGSQFHDFAIYISSNSPTTSSIVAIARFTTTEAELDVSNYSGFYYIGVYTGYSVSGELISIEMQR